MRQGSRHRRQSTRRVSRQCERGRRHSAMAGVNERRVSETTASPQRTARVRIARLVRRRLRSEAHGHIVRRLVHRRHARDGPVSVAAATRPRAVVPLAGLPVCDAAARNTQASPSAATTTRRRRANTRHGRRRATAQRAHVTHARCTRAQATVGTAARAFSGARKRHKRWRYSHAGWRRGHHTQMRRGSEIAQQRQR